MIDTHQHLLYPDHFAYDWAKDFTALHGTWGLEEYHEASKGCDITGSIFMEVDVRADQSSDEARFFCEKAEDPANGILGVIAAARPELDGFETYLDTIAHPKLKGIRRVLHTQPDELSKSELFRKNIAQLSVRGLTFDLCMQQSQLGHALALAQACPETVIILDHCGVPDIAGNHAPQGEGFCQWRKQIQALAECRNVHGKISGLTAYAAELQRTVEGLEPYVETMLEAFSPERLVWGGDWPVVNIGSGLPAWCDLSKELLSELSEAEQAAVFTGNAQRIYSL